MTDNAVTDTTMTDTAMTDNAVTDTAMTDNAVTDTAMTDAIPDTCCIVKYLHLATTLIGGS